MLQLLAVLALLAAPADARTVTDSAGRNVEIPDEIDTVFAAGPPAAVLLVLAPDRLAGWPGDPSGGAPLYRRAMPTCLSSAR